MILHAHSGFRGKVYDLDTGQVVSKVISLDTDKGELEAYEVDHAGNCVADINGDYLTYRARGRFKFVPANGAPIMRRIVMGAPSCVKCGSKLTLQGGDLCAFCNALDKEIKGFKVEPIPATLIQPCQKPGCSRSAVYMVSDEVEVTPEIGTFLGERAAYERGATVARCYWCSWHYKPPRLLDAKGEVTEELEVGTRP